jgi:hypothetical protein
MIKKIYIFNEHKQTRLVKTYSDTHSNTEIQSIVLSEKDTSICGDIVFRKFNTIYICFVIENENEMYILSLINMLVDCLSKEFPALSELHFVYNFKEVYDLVDRIFAGGYVVNTNINKRY